MNYNKIQTNFISEIDLFLNAFDREHPELSQSQLKELAKYKRIYALRDNPKRPDESKLPEWF